MALDCAIAVDDDSLEHLKRAILKRNADPFTWDHLGKPSRVVRGEKAREGD